MSSVGTDSELVTFVSKLDLDNVHPLLDYMSTIGIHRLEHLEDFKVETDVDGLPLKEMEKRRFVRVWRKIALSMNWSGQDDLSSLAAPIISYDQESSDHVPDKARIQHSCDYLRRRKAKYMRTYRKKLRQDPDRRDVLNRIQESDRQRYKRYRQGNTVNGRSNGTITSPSGPNWSQEPQLQNSSKMETSTIGVQVPLEQQQTMGEPNRATISIDELNELFEDTETAATAVDRGSSNVMSIKEKNKMVAGQIAVEVVFGDRQGDLGGILPEVLASGDSLDPVPLDGDMEPRPVAFCHSPLPAEESLFQEPKPIDDDVQYEEGVKCIWKNSTIGADYENLICDVDYMATGEIVVCTKQQVVMLSREGSPIRMPLDTSLGCAKSVCVNKATGAMAFAVDRTQLIHIYHNQKGTSWNHTIIHVLPRQYCRLKRISWANSTSLVALATKGVRKNGELLVAYDIHGNLLWKHIINNTGSKSRSSIIVTLPYVYRCYKYVSRIQVYNVSKTSCYMERYFPKDKHVKMVHDPKCMVSDSRGRILILHKKYNNYECLWSITMWNSDGSFIRTVMDGIKIKEYCRVSLILYNDTMLCLAAKSDLCLFDISGVLSL